MATNKKKIFITESMSQHGRSLLRERDDIEVVEFPNMISAGDFEAMLKAHMRWAESDGREGKPADLSGLDLRWVKDLSKRKLTALIAPGATLYGVDFTGTSLQGSNLSGCDLRSARFTGADLRGVNMSGAKLNHADLRESKLGPLLIASERLLPARLDHAEARYADFRGADLRRIRMTGSDFSCANLSTADLRDADLTNVELAGAKLPMKFAEVALG